MNKHDPQEDSLGKAIDAALEKIAREKNQRPRIASYGHDSLREHERAERLKKETRAGCIGAMITAGVLGIPLAAIIGQQAYILARSYLRPIPANENKIGNSDPEEYITLYGKRYYSKIDEIPIEEYFLTEPERSN